MKKITNQKKSTAERGPSGQFSPGKSGNPKGRPKSETVALRQSLAFGAEDVVKAILDAAKDGDMTAAKLVLDRLCPPLKSIAQPVHLTLPHDASPLTVAKAVISATASGMLPPDVSAQLVTALGTLCRIEETEELRDRITALENAIPDK
jgi:hypothetical protein